MSWRVAKCLDQLLGEINASAPGRNKASDGSIGDADHQNSNSDHNPWCQGWVVTARDFTHDPGGGFDSYAFADWLRQRCRGDILLNGERETRVKYVISNRQIASPTDNWAWRYYDGSNPHDHHCHVSVDCTGEGGSMDSTDAWGWSGGSAGEDDSMLCNYGDKNDKVTAMQVVGQLCGYTITSDGDYGPATAQMLVDLNVVGWDTTGHTYGPSEYAKLHQLLGSKSAAGGGEQGPQGEMGLPGPEGPQGPPGKDGVGVGAVVTMTGNVTAVEGGDAPQAETATATEEKHRFRR